MGKAFTEWIQQAMFSGYKKDTKNRAKRGKTNTMP
jgi:hypothetical protein